MSSKNLYDYNTYFKLIIAGVPYFIDEPVDWDKISIQNERDMTVFGFNESYVDDKKQLGFAADKFSNDGSSNKVPSYDLIKNVYENEGSDGQVILEFGYIIAGVQKWQYKGTLNLNTYQDNDQNEQGIITCSVEKMAFNDKFRTRLDTPINLSSQASLDGTFISPATFLNLKLRSKVLSRQYLATVNTPESAESGPIARFYSVQPDTSSPSISELEEGQGLPLSISGIDPRDESKYFFKAQDSGNYKIDIKAVFDFQLLRPNLPVGNWFFVPRFMIQRRAMAKAVAVLNGGQISGGSIIGINIENQGGGYSYANITITGDGSGATATAAIADGKIVGVAITNGGQGYTNATATVTGDGSGAVLVINDGKIISVNVTNGGQGYSAASISFLGDGTGASATAVINSGVITGINVTNQGTGYTRATVVIDGDPEIATIEATTFEDFRKSGNGQSLIVDTNMNFSATLDRTLESGDLLYIDFFGQAGQSGAQYRYFVTNYTSQIRLTAQTFTDDSFSKVYRYFDVINKGIEAITGQPDSLISSVLSPGGRCYDYFITNGYQIRGFGLIYKPVITTLKDAITAICNIFGLGYGFTIRNGVEKLIIENIDFFFKDRQAARIDNNYDYYEEHASEFVFNEVVVGYEKYPTLSTANGTGNTLDEFNTYHQYLLPIKTFKAPFNKKSPYIASGYAIETQRREQFKSNPSESLSNDDDIFIMSAKDIAGVLQTQGSEDFDSVTGVLSPETSIDLRITPARMFFNWSKFLSIGLVKKKTTDPIIATFVQNNNTLVSKLKSTDPYNQFEPSFPLGEGSNFTVGQYTADNRGPIHEPRWCYFKADIKYDQIIDLINKLSFIDQTPDDGGWIVFSDNKNVLWTGYVYSVKYSPVDEVAEFKVARKGLF